MDTSRRELLQTGSLAFLGLTAIATAAEQQAGDGQGQEDDKMFVHVHLFKFKPEVNEEEIAAVMKAKEARTFGTALKDYHGRKRKFAADGWKYEIEFGRKHSRSGATYPVHVIRLETIISQED